MDKAVLLRGAAVWPQLLSDTIPVRQDEPDNAPADSQNQQQEQQKCGAAAATHPAPRPSPWYGSAGRRSDWGWWEGHDSSRLTLCEVAPCPGWSKVAQSGSGVG